jgi:hypothetical protein
MATAPNSETYSEPGGLLSVVPARPALEAKLNRSPGKIGMVGFGVVLLVGIIYSAFHLLTDLSTVHSGSIMPYVLLGIALLVAFGFEFVNGFHDTANAVATVIYTHSLEPHIAVGVLEFSGSVDFEWAGRFRNHFFIAGGTDFAGGEQGWVRDGFRAAGRSHYLESGNLVFRLAGFEFAHFNWVDYWRGHCESVDVSENGNQRRGLGAGHEHWEVAAAVAAGGIRGRISPVVVDEGAGQESRAL